MITSGKHHEQCKQREDWRFHKLAIKNQLSFVNRFDFTGGTIGFLRQRWSSKHHTDASGANQFRESRLCEAGKFPQKNSEIERTNQTMSRLSIRTQQCRFIRHRDGNRIGLELSSDLVSSMNFESGVMSSIQPMHFQPILAEQNSENEQRNTSFGKRSGRQSLIVRRELK